MGQCYFCSRNQDFPSAGSSKPSSKINSDDYTDISHQNANATSNGQIDDDDDFDPRGTAATSKFLGVFPAEVVGFCNVTAV